MLRGRHCTKRSQAQIPREGDVHAPPAASSSEYAMFWLSEMTLTTVVYFFFSSKCSARCGRLQVKPCWIFCRIFQEQQWVRGGLFNFQCPS